MTRKAELSQFERDLLESVGKPRPASTLPSTRRKRSPHGSVAAL